MRNTEVLTSKVTEVSYGNGSNILDIAIEQEEGVIGNECFDDFFDDKVPYLRQK